MTDLTEQWLKGELPEGVYYVTYYKNDTPGVDIYRQIFSFHNKPIKNFTDSQVIKVLAPVPSYDEWKNFENANTNLFDAVKMLVKDNFLLEKQNAELKETNEALESELKEVCDVLIRKCPEMKEWVMLNWKNLYEVKND